MDDRSRLHHGALAVTTLLCGTLLFGPADAGPDHATYLLVAALVALGGFAALEARRRVVSRRAVLACCGLLLVLAAVLPLHRSRDVWSYAVLGRLVSAHHADPYVASPSDFPDDPYLERVEPAWRHGVTVYGPGFVGIAAAITEVTGTSALATRLAFQGLAAAAMAAVLVLVDRRTRDPLAVALVGLHPAVVLYVVGGGHADALIALGLLAGVLLAGRHPGWAGLVVATAALVKLVALLGVVALAVWVWTNRSRRAALVLAGSATATVAGGYALAGGRSALHALGTARDNVSWPSIWKPVQERLVADGAHVMDTHLGRPALAVVLVSAGLLVLARRRDATPELVVAAAMVAYVLGAAYTLLWYAVWVLPLVALRLRAGLARVVFAYTAVLLVAAEHSPFDPPDRLDRILEYGIDLVHVVAAVALAALVALALAHLARTQRASAASNASESDPPPSPDRSGSAGRSG